MLSRFLRGWWPQPALWLTPGVYQHVLRLVPLARVYPAVFARTWWELCVICAGLCVSHCGPYLCSLAMAHGFTLHLGFECFVGRNQGASMCVFLCHSVFLVFGPRELRWSHASAHGKGSSLVLGKSKPPPSYTSYFNHP